MTRHARSRPADRVILKPAARREAVLDTIRGATSRISLSLFRCNDPAVFDELALAVARGVAVDVLVTSRAKGGRKKLKKLWSRLEDTGAAVHAFTDLVVKYHAKYLVVDDGPALITSLNFTRKCFETTCDAVVLTHDPGVVSGLRAIMAADRTGQPAPDDLSDRLIVGPERARRQLTALIDSARSSIHLVDAKVSDPALIAFLNAKRANGVAVDVYGQKRLGALKSHGKIMLIAGERAVAGSLALAALSLDFRREVSVLVDEPAAIAEIAELFRSMGPADAAAGAAEAVAGGVS